jgi:hypothetical protein
MHSEQLGWQEWCEFLFNRASYLKFSTFQNECHSHWPYWNKPCSILMVSKGSDANFSRWSFTAVCLQSMKSLLLCAEPGIIGLAYLSCPGTYVHAWISLQHTQTIAFESSETINCTCRLSLPCEHLHTSFDQERLYLKFTSVSTLAQVFTLPRRVTVVEYDVFKKLWRTSENMWCKWKTRLYQEVN